MVGEYRQQAIIYHVQLNSTSTTSQYDCLGYFIWIEKPQAAAKLDTGAPSTVSVSTLAKCMKEASGDSNFSCSSGNTQAVGVLVQGFNFRQISVNCTYKRQLKVQHTQLI